MAAVDLMAKWLDTTWTKDRNMKALVAQSSSTSLPIDFVLLKSKHPMNNNGKSVVKAGEIELIIITIG